MRRRLPRRPARDRSSTSSILDLDVIVHPDLTYYVRDQEVFAERSETMGYSPEAHRAAHMGIGIALRLVRRRLFPFDGHPERLVRDALSRTP